MTNNDPHAEKKIAIRAEKIATAALRQKIGTLGFKQHVSKDAGKTIADGKVTARYKLGPSKVGDVRYYLNSLVLEMPRHAYVQHYGDNGVREGHTRTRHQPKTTTYSVRTHSWNLPEKDFIGQAIRQSGVIDYVLVSITAIRGEGILLGLNYLFDKD